MLGILVLAGVILLPVLLPVAATAHAVMKANNSTSNGTFNDLDKLAMGHIEVSTIHSQCLACLNGYAFIFMRMMIIFCNDVF